MTLEEDYKKDEAMHYLKVLQKYGVPFQLEIRNAIDFAIRELSK